ncbi:hypothetical protein JOY44_23335 [Phormidium sp. CLA17]|uniref:hypothetical protein n=1 Tax=Leptolyngbya sp. Cla-17 TaxID=2803751 RepID=UPI001490C622|nr:hypothetical protein [Leptolyngbya sp. Cla-17]MBM0744505.1 hypothetical protein [Leptolyngbya sp. Cla-17]
MAEIARNKFVRAGDWRTLESGWNATYSCRFQNPTGAQVKIRYGVGWLGWDSQKKTLDGTNKLVNVTRASVANSRVQVKVLRDTEVSYTYITTGE